MDRRILRETATISVMIRDYCRAVHGGKDICPQCLELLDYALDKLRHCPFGEGKTVCALCPVHCYHPEMRQRIRTVMRYCGPQMIYRHPVRALFHIFDRRRKAPLASQGK